MGAEGVDGGSVNSSIHLKTRSAPLPFLSLEVDFYVDLSCTFGSFYADGSCIFYGFCIDSP